MIPMEQFYLTTRKLSYAERTIRELQREDEYKNQGLMMIVTDETRSMVLALPFLPGSA